MDPRTTNNAPITRFALLLILLSAIATGGCASIPDLSREQIREMTTKTYPKHSPETVSRAAERVLRLADGDDMEFSYDGPNFVATRDWFMYAVITAAFGTNYYRFDAEPAEDGGGTVARMRISGSAAGIGAVGTGGGGAMSTTVPSGAKPAQNPAIYELFWARLDYMLDERRTWMDCADIRKRIDEEELWWNNLSPFCSVTLADERPADAPDPDPNPAQKASTEGKGP